MRWIVGFRRLVVCVAAGASLALAPAATPASASASPRSAPCAAKNATDPRSARRQHGTPPGHSLAQRILRGATAQTLQVGIRGGILRVMPAVSSIALTRHGGRLHGDLPPVTVTDARGTLAGWTVHAIATSVAPHPTLIDPLPIVAITGVEGQAGAGCTTRLDTTGTSGAALASAPPGGGGGEFEIRASLWTPARGKATAAITLRITVSG
jgi:hypothetical protein